MICNEALAMKSSKQLEYGEFPFGPKIRYPVFRKLPYGENIHQLLQDTGSSVW